MKSAVFCLTSSLLFTLVMNSKAEAAGFNFPDVTPDPNPLQILGPAGEEFTFVKTGATTDGRYSFAEAIIPPGAGPLPHIHHYTDEWFYTPDGQITLEMGDGVYSDINLVPGINLPKEHLHTIQTTPGSLFYGPRYHMHGFVNNGTTPARLWFVWTPDAGITDYFKEVGQPLPNLSDPPPVNPVNKALFVSQAPKYGINQSSYFGEYVDSVDSNFPMEDNHANELLALLAPDVKSVPESSSTLGILTFGVLVVNLILKRKHKLVSKVRLVLMTFTVNHLRKFAQSYRSSNKVV